MPDPAHDADRPGDFHLFRDLPEDLLKALEAEARWFRADPGDVIIDAEGGTGHGVFVLAEGAVDVSRAVPDGDPISLGSLSAPCWVGEFAAIDGVSGSARVRASTPCLIAEIPAETFARLMQDYPALTLLVLEKAVSIIRRLDEDVTRLRVLEHRHGDIYRRSLVWCL